MRPLRIEIELEKDWPSRLGLSGTVELKMIVSSKPVPLQGRWPSLKRQLSETDRLPAAKPWQGLLCTPAVRLDLPELSSEAEESQD